MEVVDFYKAVNEISEDGDKVVECLEQTHWFLTYAVLDVKSGKPLPQNLTDFLANVYKRKDCTANTPLRERIWMIAEHCKKSLVYLFSHLNEAPKRVHENMAIRNVRELDASCFTKLCNRPGRNIREKLAGKPYLTAVKRYQSVDLPENQLLKAFAIRLRDLLVLRKESLSLGSDFDIHCVFDEDDDLVGRINGWLRSDEAKSISAWKNLPPNNTLLSHRDYKRIWTAWRWTQSLPNDLEQDLRDLQRKDQVIRNWKNVARARVEMIVSLYEVPLVFNLDKFEIKPLVPGSLRYVTKNGDCSLAMDKPIPALGGRFRSASRLVDFREQDLSCVDFSCKRPVYSSGNGSCLLPKKLVWQSWMAEDDQVYESTMLNGDRIDFETEGVKSVSSCDLFFHQDKDVSLVENGAYPISMSLANLFRNERIVWLVPDQINDFQLAPVLSAMGSAFPKAECLPRSVAAVYEKVDLKRVKDGMIVAVKDCVDGIENTTFLKAHLSKAILKKAPETYGFYWERLPEGNLKAWLTIFVNVAPVEGGLRFTRLQDIVPGTALWHDNLPDLSMMALLNGVMDRFDLVRNKKREVAAGEVQDIPVEGVFTLGPGIKEFEFPLSQGRFARKFQYMAVLRSSQFPLDEKVPCELKMTYTYGRKGNPYELTFVPKDPRIHPIVVQWERMSEREVDVTQLAVPTYPQKKNWGSFEMWPAAEPGTYRDLTALPIKELFGQRTLRRVRYSVNQIWKDGRRLSDRDVPDDFCKTAQRMIQSLLKKWSGLDQSQELRREIQNVLCMMHKDCPQEVVDAVNEELQSEPFYDTFLMAGFLIGDCSTKWQRLLLQALTSLFSYSAEGTQNRFRALKGLSIALWRSKKVVFELDATACRGMCKYVLGCLKFAPGRLETSMHDENGLKKVYHQIRTSLEVLVSLIRLRGSADQDLSSLFIPNNELSMNFESALGSLKKGVQNFEVDPKIPEMVDALLSMLRGNSATISIDSEEDLNEGE